MDNNLDNSNDSIQNTIINIPTKANKVMKTLSESKLKRLNILTFINEKKEILFTKKAYKFEKERIWKQIFQKMKDSGMVSAEKDWRYVRDVSFSNWRKRAQKRLKHLSANGFRLNMDECEFLISDLLGQTPDKKTILRRMLDAKQQQQSRTSPNMDDDDDDDDESDEYMIDSDEDDEDVVFDEMLFIPKVVINDIDGNINDNETKVNTSTVVNDIAKNPPTNPAPRAKIPVTNKQQTNQEVVENKPKPIMNTAIKLNGQCGIGNVNGKMVPVKNNIESDSKLSTPNKPNDQRLLELEIENKILKNRYMKLKIFKLEKNLGFDHCDEVKEMIHWKTNIINPPLNKMLQNPLVTQNAR